MKTFFFILFLSLIIFCVQKKYKFFGSDYIVLLIEIFLLIFTVNNPDRLTYENAYYTGYGPFYEQGFYYIKDILGFFGINNYNFFLFLIAIFIIFVFYKWKKIIPNIYTVIFLYSLFCMYYDVIQIRYTIAQFLIVLALYFLIQEKKILCLLICFIAPQFHRMSLLLVLILLYLLIMPPKKEYSLSYLELLVLSIFGFMSIFLSKPLINFISSYIPFLRRISSYMINYTSFDSLLIWAGYLLLVIIILYYFAVKKILNIANKNIILKRQVNTMYRFIFWGIAVMGLLIYMNEFNRAYRTFYLVAYLLYGKVRNQISKKNRIIIYLLLCLINIIFMFVAMSRGLLFDLYW